MTIRSTIMASAARAQARRRLRVSDRYVRGVEVVYIDQIDGDAITWTTGTGERLTRTREAFLSRNLQKLTAPPMPDGVADLLAAVWAVAGSRQIEPAERLAIINRAFPGLRNVATAEQRPTIDQWLAALRAGEEPQR